MLAHVFLSKLLGCFKVATFLEILRFCVAFQLPKDQNFGLFITWCVLVGFGLFQSVERRECCVVYEQVFFLRGALTWVVSKCVHEDDNVVLFMSKCSC